MHAGDIADVDGVCSARGVSVISPDAADHHRYAHTVLGVPCGCTELISDARVVDNDLVPFLPSLRDTPTLGGGTIAHFGGAGRGQHVRFWGSSIPRCTPLRVPWHSHIPIWPRASTYRAGYREQNHTDDT